MVLDDLHIENGMFFNLFEFNKFKDRLHQRRTTLPLAYLSLRFFLNCFP